ncbi:MAG: fibronectin type III domain-containing protein, partial [Bacteroidota bacterium]
MVSSNACCPSTTCPRPTAQSIISMDDSSAMINWTNPATVVGSEIRYRAVGDPTWISAGTVTSSSYLLGGLNLCTEYEVQVRSYCASDSSAFCQLLRVETDGCCRAPMDITPVSIDAASATLNWSPVYGAIQYDIQYRPLGTLPWLSTTIPDTSVQLADLEPCKGYEYQLKPKCDTLGNIFSALDTFYTEGCEACATAPYCIPGGTTNLNWVDSVSVGPIRTQTGSNAGYLDFGISSDEMEIDSTYEFFLKRGGPAAFPRKWAIWLDLNQDGDFDDNGEELFSSGAVQDTILTGSFTLGPLVQRGRTRLRVGSLLSFDPNATFAPCDTGISGEYEDYCLNLVAPCAVPTNFVATLDSGDSSVFVVWQSAPYSDSFLLDYRPISDSVWTTVGVGDVSFYQLTTTELNSCTEYVFRLRTA